MLKRILYLAGWDLALILRHRETLMWMFLMPVLFMFIIGSMMGAGDTTATHSKLTVLDLDGGPVAKDLLAHLGSLGYDVVSTASESELAAARRHLTIPAGFSAAAIRGERQTLVFEKNEEMDLSARLDEVQVNRAVFRTIGDLALAIKRDSLGYERELAAIRSEPPAINVEVRSAGKRLAIPTGFQQAVPGVMIQFMLMVLLTTGGTLLVVDRDTGLLRRLATSPYSSGEIVAGKILARLATGLVQAAFAMVVGTLAFHVDWGGSFAGVLLTLFLFAASGATLSVLFGNLATSRGQAVGLGVLGGNVLSALGGCWWPIEITPPFMQRIGYALPTGWAMHALHRLMSFGDPLSAALPALLALLASALAFFFLAVRTFRYQ